MIARATMRSVRGAFALLRRRAVALRQPGLTVWTEAGDRAAAGVGAAIRDGAHRAEVGAGEVERTLAAVLADGKISPGEIKQLFAVKRQVGRVAAECHDLGEVAS